MAPVCLLYYWVIKTVRTCRPSCRSKCSCHHHMRYRHLLVLHLDRMLLSMKLICWHLFQCRCPHPLRTVFIQHFGQAECDMWFDRGPNWWWHPWPISCMWYRDAGLRKIKWKYFFSPDTQYQSVHKDYCLLSWNSLQSLNSLLFLLRWWLNFWYLCLYER